MAVTACGVCVCLSILLACRTAIMVWFLVVLVCLCLQCLVSCVSMCLFNLHSGHLCDMGSTVLNLSDV